jgi:hypothetical protein
MAIDLEALSVAFPGYKTQWGIDEFLFSAQGNDLEHSRKAAKIKASGFGTRVQNNLPGMQEGALKIKGLATMGKGQLNYILNQRFGRTSPVDAWYALQGLDPLAPITMQPSSIIDSSISAKLEDPVDFDLELDARGDYNDGFILLSPMDLLTIPSGVGPVDDNTLFGGATAAGGAAQLHVWAFDGGSAPTVTVTIEHSADNGVTWLPLISFPTLSALGARRVKLPSTTVVNSQVQATFTVTGAPTDVQVLCGFARGVNLDV